MRSFVYLIAALLAYLIAGRVGLSLAIPPGFASAVWPASGVALAMALLYPRTATILGVGLGSFILNLSITSSNFSQVTLESALPAAGIALGAIGQVILGVYLYTRYLQDLTVLAISKRLAQFSLIVVPVGCLVGATWGAMTLYVTDVLALGRVPFTWLTWWVGDMLGVMLMTPLLLSVLSPVSGLNLVRKLQVVLPIVMIFIAIWFFFLLSLNNNQNKIQSRFDLISNNVHKDIEERFSLLKNKLLAFSAFFNASEHVERKEFKRFSEILLSHDQIFDGIGWTEIIPNSKRQQLEQDYREQGYFDFTLKEFSNDGKLVPAKRRDFYYPVLYIYPYEPNKKALGLDLGSEGSRRKALFKAQEMNEPVATAPLTLAQETDNFKSTILYAPIYKIYDVKLGHHFLGYVSGVVRFKKTFGNILEDAKKAGLTISIFDRTEEKKDSYLIRADSMPVTQLKSNQNIIQFGSRKYLIDIFATPEFLAGHRDWGSWLILTGGFLMAALLQAFLLNIVNSISIVRSQVAEKTKELRETTDKANQANEAKSQFLANMSHELRTPLNAIIGFVNLCLKGDLTTKQSEYLGNVNLASNTLLGLINQTLDFSKIEAGKLELDIREFSLLDLLKKMRALFYLSAKEKGLDFEIQIVDSLPVNLIGDSLRIEQIILNLLGNALKFTSAGFIRMTIEQVGEVNEDIRLNITIEDSGIGIPEDKVERLFEAFSQADSSTSRKYGGTGLGLSISLALSELMGGTLSAVSEQGKGSRFRLSLPFPSTTETSQFTMMDLNKHQETAVQNSALDSIEGTVLNGLRVLLVEDVLLNQTMAKELLESHGMIISIANNGQEAIDALLQSPHFDVILMDLQMPIMDGYEASKRIREKVEFDNIPIIAMTANAMEDDVQRCLSAGMQGHVSKPIDEQILLKTILSHISRFQ